MTKNQNNEMTDDVQGYGRRPEDYSDAARGYSAKPKLSATPNTLKMFTIPLRRMREIHRDNPFISLYVINNTSKIGNTMPFMMEIIDKDGVKIGITVPATWIPWEITNADIQSVLESSNFRRVVDNEYLLIMNPFEAEHILGNFSEAKTERSRVHKSASRYEGFDGINPVEENVKINKEAEDIREAIRAAVDSKAEERTFIALLNNIRFGSGSKLNPTEIRFIRENVSHEKVLDMMAML